jgi:hypothetical protein
VVTSINGNNVTWRDDNTGNLITDVHEDLELVNSRRNEMPRRSRSDKTRRNIRKRGTSMRPPGPYLGDHPEIQSGVGNKKQRWPGYGVVPGNRPRRLGQPNVPASTGSKRKRPTHINPITPGNLPRRKSRPNVPHSGVGNKKMRGRGIPIEQQNPWIGQGDQTQSGCGQGWHLMSDGTCMEGTTHGGARYYFHDGTPYNGKVLTLNGITWTTTSGAKEGNSQRVTKTKP